MSYQFKHAAFTDEERAAIEQDHIETLAAEAEIAGRIIFTLQPYNVHINFDNYRYNMLQKADIK